jgi:hypothetical protein
MSVRNTSIKLFQIKIQRHFLDKEVCVVLVCSLSCHNKLIKIEKVVPDKAWKKWSNDNTDPTWTTEVWKTHEKTTSSHHALQYP